MRPSIYEVAPSNQFKTITIRIYFAYTFTEIEDDLPNVPWYLN